MVEEEIKKLFYDLLLLRLLVTCACLENGVEYSIHVYELKLVPITLYFIMSYFIEKGDSFRISDIKIKWLFFIITKLLGII